MSNNRNSGLLALLAFLKAMDAIVQEKKTSLLWVTLVHYSIITLVAHKSMVTLNEEIQNVSIVA